MNNDKVQDLISHCYQVSDLLLSLSRLTSEEDQERAIGGLAAIARGLSAAAEEVKA